MDLPHALWLTPSRGLLTLAQDWKLRRLPQVHSSLGHKIPLLRAPGFVFAQQSGYCCPQEGSLRFYAHVGSIPVPWKEVYLGCGANGWGATRWPLQPCEHEGYYALDVDVKLLSLTESFNFKFFTDSDYWLPLAANAPNRALDNNKNSNYAFLPALTGRHIFYFRPPKGVNPWHLELVWKDASLKIHPGPALLNIHTQRPLGVTVTADSSTFALFAPRATQVLLGLRAAEHQAWRFIALEPQSDGTWTHTEPGYLMGYHYGYRVEGSSKMLCGHWDPNKLLLDPYAKACVHPSGPGLIVDPQRLRAYPKDAFEVPEPQDVVLIEAHVRDFLALTQGQSALGLEALGNAIGSGYLKSLGVNALELQPLQEFDAPTPSTYHWGYMPTNLFSPASSLSEDPQSGSGIAAMKALVAACHKAGLAVILDVVCNHVGEPNPLLYIDKYLYLRVDDQDQLENMSGCGNDLRCEAPMVTRLLIDSLLHWVQVYGIDGFRFDLADLIPLPVLEKIQHALKAAKPNLLLYAEPWSFKGHCALALKYSDYACWNDGFRDFLLKYLNGYGNAEGLAYFFAGSIDHLSNKPWQSLNYTQSHDDRTWIDRLTENPHYNGQVPTQHDRQRTHLMFALLLCSLGTPMLASGQDFFHSKQGLANTYQRGDLNALDPQRLLTHRATHEYVCAWIALRRSPLGALLRLKERPAPGYLRSFVAPGSSSVALLINANNSHPGQPGASPQLLFAINPHLHNVSISLPSLPNLVQIADSQRVQDPLPWPLLPISPDGVLTLPPLSCGLWKAEG